MTPDQQPALSKDSAPIDGHILHAEAYPRNEETIMFHLVYSESLGGGNYVGRQFEVGKADAEALARTILQIIAEPDTKTAWLDIAAEVDEEDGSEFGRAERHA